MPYENPPAENAPALPVRTDEWTFKFDLEGTFADGTPRSTVYDLDLFSTENNTSNKQMLDFLDRVVTKVERRGEVVTTKVPIKDDKGEIVRTDERVEGVRGKNIPYACLKRLMEGVGTAMKEANDPK